MIPVHNCLPYLPDTLGSLRDQSLADEEMEVIAVDDGSTDGSADLLASWAASWPCLQVVTRAASGAAGPPRNVGIERARGDYVFFLDGDDCLGPEALERLLAMARRNDSDVVYGKVVGVGRAVEELFTEDIDHADLTADAYYSLTTSKLIRRGLLLDHGIRFPEDVRIMEDQPFMSSCLLVAKVVSILSSYDCYYLVRREDGSNTSAEGLPLETVLAQADRTVESVRAATDPGEVRDRFVGRHLRVELLRKFGADHLAKEPHERRHRVAVAAPYARSWWDERLDHQLTVGERLLVRAVACADPELVDTVARWIRHGCRGRSLWVEDRWLLAAPGYGTTEGYADSVYAMTTPPPAVAEVERVEIVDGVLRVHGRSYVVGIDPLDTRRTVSLVAGDGQVDIAMSLEPGPSTYLNAALGCPGLSYAGAGFIATLDLHSVAREARFWRVVVEMEHPGGAHVLASVPTRQMRPADSVSRRPDGLRVRHRVGVGRRGFVVVSETPADDSGRVHAPGESTSWRLLARRAQPFSSRRR